MGKMKCLSFVTALALMAPLSGRAESITVVAGTDATTPSAFTLDFGPNLGRSVGQISYMDIELEVDPDTGSAHFNRYYQEVDALTLPGGISTGNLTIEIVDNSSSGTFDEQTGVVSTTDTYAIYFDGDLSAFGLTSPVLLPSTSSGRVSASALSGGAVIFDWAGVGQLANPFDPTTSITFQYTCESNASFDPDAYTAVRIGLVPSVRSLLLPQVNESRLVRDLDTVLDYLARANNGVAAFWLQRFVVDVVAMSPNPIAANKATMLIDEANAVVNALGVHPPKAEVR